MTDDEERLWINGNRAAYRRILSECLRNLDAADIPFPAALAHLEDTRAALRRVCAEHGDNDWDDRLHLSDVVEKHLGRHLDEKFAPLVHALTGSELTGNTRCGDGPESSVKVDEITCPRCWRKLWEQAVKALEAP